MKKDSKAASLALIAALALLVLTFSIAVPILCRPFYYAHISALDLPARTGWSAETIRQAYDQVLDFCVFGAPCGTGELAWSESGMSHFADVRVLFVLDLWVLGLSLAALAAAFVYCRRRRVRPQLLLGHGPGFWAAVGLGAVFLVIGGLAALDFQRAFVVFHSIFFPGKSNWLFDWQTDPIILLLPEAFFRNCALLIFGLLILWCAVLIGADLWAGKRRRQQTPPLPSCSGCPSCQ